MTTDDLTSLLTPESFRLVVDNSNDHITLSDADGAIMYANQAVEHLTGFSRSEILGKKAGSKELWGGLMSQEFYKELWDQIKNKKQPFRGEFKNKRKDGSIFYASASIFPVLDEQNNIKFFVEVHHDITREKELEKAKTDFLSFVGHKLQTPLTVTKWSLELLENSQNLSNEQQRFTQDAVLANQRMIELVGELLHMGRVELGKFSITPTPTDPTAVMKDVVDELRPLIDKKQLAVKEEYGQIGSIPLDKKILKAVYLSVFANAVHFTPDNGHIDITLDVDKSNDEFLTTISDTGFGVSPVDRPKIFSKFFRSRDAQLSDPQGTGIGLFNAKSFINAGGGRIWFSSPSKIGTADNPGTTFYISLPRSGMKAKDIKEDERV